MNIIIVDNKDIGKTAVKYILDIVKNNPSATLGLATGSTPIPLYDEMVNDYKINGTSYANIHTFNLDEYVGLPKEHKESYINFMTRNLFARIDINMQNVNIPNGLACDIPAECKRYSDLLKNNLIDIQVLGIGGNGHIAFNEPNTPFDSTTHQVFLTEKTIKDNSRFFNSVNEVPTSALSMGIGEIMRAKKILMIATGANKADAVYNMVKGDITEACPASILQRHPDCVVILDKESSAKL